MRFHLEQRFSAPPDVVARAYTEPGFYVLAGEMGKLGGADVLAREEGTDGTIRMAVRYAFTGHLSPAVTKVVDPARLTWVEHSTHDLARGVVDFRLVPDHYPDRLRSSGSYTFSAEGDGSLRLTEGVVSIRLPIVGPKVEEAIVSGLEEHLACEVGAVERYLAERNGP
ncbi:MAG: DUF2505 family protein [Acidimicrobiia bacterium]